MTVVKLRFFRFDTIGQLAPQNFHKTREVQRVHVLPDAPQNKPISEIPQIHHFQVRRVVDPVPKNPWLPSQEEGSVRRHEPRQTQVKKTEERQPEQHGEPHPQEEIDLHVEGIDGKNTDGVDCIHKPWCAELLEVAVGDQGEHLDGVLQTARVVVGGEEMSQSHELAVEEYVEEVALDQQVDEGQKLAEDVFEGVGEMTAPSVHDVRRSVLVVLVVDLFG